MNTNTASTAWVWKSGVQRVPLPAALKQGCCWSGWHRVMFQVMLCLVLSEPVSPSLSLLSLCHRRFCHKQTCWQRPPRKVPRPSASTGNLYRGSSDPSAGSWAVQGRMMASNQEHWAAKPSHLLSLLTHPTHSQGWVSPFPRETHLTHSYIQAVVLHESLSASITTLQGQWGGLRAAVTQLLQKHTSHSWRDQTPQLTFLISPHPHLL